MIDGHVIGRNAGRGDDLYQLTLFLERDFPVGFGILGLRAEVFNVTDHENVVGYNGVYGNDASGRPLPTFGQRLGGRACPLSKHRNRLATLRAPMSRAQRQAPVRLCWRSSSATGTWSRRSIRRPALLSRRRASAGRR